MSEECKMVPVSLSPPEPEPPMALPDRMEELDRLKLENAQLRMMAQQRYYDGLLLQLKEEDRKCGQLYEGYVVVLKEMGKKYQFNHETDGMDATTGVIRRKMPSRSSVE